MRLVALLTLRFFLLHCAAKITVDRSCDPYRQAMDDAVSEAKAVLNKASEKLRNPDDQTLAVHKTLFGTRPTDRIGQYEPFPLRL